VKTESKIILFLLMTSMSTEWDYVSELWGPTGLLFNPQMIAYMSMDNHGEMISTWENSWFVHRAL
jgi:hypothetical protein